MRDLGEIQYKAGKWFIKAEPHVLMRVKNVFGRIEKYQLNIVCMNHTPEVCFELRWFMQRYPLRNWSPEILEVGAELHAATMEQLSEILLPDYKPTDRALAKPLRDYQAKMVDMYLSRGYMLCADTLGLGKSVEAIATFTDKRTLPGLIVCKAHLVQQWRDYCVEFMPELVTHIVKTSKLYDLPTADVYIITYHKLFAWCERLGKICKSMVLDECQEVRHTSSGKHQAAAEIRRKVDFCLGLSATPIYNYGGEIWNVLNIISPGIVGSKDEFTREWCESSSLRDPSAFGSYLRDNYIMIRRTRAEVGRELPPVQSVIETIDYDESVIQEIDAEATALAYKVIKGTFLESGSAARELDLKLRQATGIAKAPHVADFVKALVLEEGEQVLLAAWHRECYAVYEHKLRQANIPVCYFTGTESPTQKNESKRAFIRGEAKVMFMSLRSGDGLDGLQKVCSTVVFGELDWSPGVHEQVRGRLFRDGQGQHVTEIFLISDAGSDPIIAEILGLKRAQVKGILEPGASGLEKQGEPARIKKMAQTYLAQRFNKKAEEEP